MSWTPHELPHIVGRAVADYLHFADVWTTDPRLAAQPSSAEFARSSTVTADTWASAPLNWLDSDICALVRDTHASVPEWSPAACMPGPHGLIGLESSFISLPFEAHTDDKAIPAPLDAIAWAQTGQKVRISALSRFVGITEHLSPLRRTCPLHEVLSMTIPVDAITGAGKDLAVGRVEGILDEHVLIPAGHELLSIAGTIWLLLSQPTIIENAGEITTKVKRRDRRPGEPARQLVRISTRRLTATHRTGKRESKGRTAQTRWWVRGHWRQQAWGKGRKLRKPIYIHPHTAGAKDAPVETRPIVQVIRKD